MDAAGLRHHDNLVKPDRVAPGNKVIRAAAADNLLLANNPQLDANVSTDKNRIMMTLNGTSMAAPLAAGGAALLLRRRRPSPATPSTGRAGSSPTMPPPPAPT